MSMNYWRPKSVGSAYQASPILDVIEPYREYTTVVSGLSNYNSTLGAGGGVHTRACAAWMTGVLARPTEGGGRAAGHHGRPVCRPASSAKRRGSTRWSSPSEKQTKRVGNCEYNYSCLYEASISWRSPTVPNPSENNPRVVFERLFGEESEPDARLRRLKKDASILDTFGRSWRVCRGRLGSSDRATVTEYLEAVRDLERQIQKAERSNAASDVAMERPLGMARLSSRAGQDHAGPDFLAYQADLTRVITFPLGGHRGRRPRIISVDWRAGETPRDSHHQNNPEKLTKLSKINTYTFTLFTRLLER